MALLRQFSVMLLIRGKTILCVTRIVESKQSPVIAPSESIAVLKRA